MQRRESRTSWKPKARKGNRSVMVKDAATAGVNRRLDHVTNDADVHFVNTKSPS